MANTFIFKSKYNFVILELTGQPCCDLERNNSKNVWNRSLINCFRIDSMSSNLNHTTTHLSMQHCFYVVFYIIGTTIVAYYASWKAIRPSKLVSNGYISNHNKTRHPPLKFKISFHWYFCYFCIHFTQINIENFQK